MPLMTLVFKGVDQATGVIDNINKKMATLDGSAGGAGSMLQTAIVGGIAGITTVGAVTAIAGITSAVLDMAATAGDVADLRASFDELSASYGQSAEKMLAASRLGSRGLVKDAELIAESNRAMMLGVADNTNEIARLWALAEKNADGLGQSIDGVFNSLVSGINTRATKALSAAGVVVDIDAAMNDYAATLGKTAAQLSIIEQKQAVLNAVIAQAPTPGTGVDSAADALQRYEVAADRAKLAVGEFLAPSATAGANATTDTIDLWLGRFDAYAAKLRDVSILAAQFAEDSRNDPTQVENFNLLATAMADVGAALHAGVPNAEQYADALMKIAGQAQLTRNISQQTANTIALASSSIKDETTAYQALRATLDGVDPKMDQVRARTAAAGQAAATATPEFIEAASKLDALGQMALMAATDVNTLNAAVGALNARMAGMAPIFGSLQSMRQGAIAGLQGKAMQAIEAGGDPEEIRDMYAAAADQIWNMPLALDATNEAMFDNQLAVAGAADTLGGDYFQAIIDADSASRQFATQGAKQLTDQFNDLKGKVAGVINESMNLGDIKWPGSDGGRQGDAANENARRLAAIANEGLAGQSWLPEFEKEVPNIYAMLVASGDPKAEAARLMGEFQQGLRPELLDKEMIKARVKAMILGDANSAALAQEIAQELATEMGISLQQAQAAVAETMGTGGATVKNATTGVEDGIVAGADGGGVIERVAIKMEATYQRMFNAGKGAGQQWGSGFMTTVETSIGVPLINLLVALVTPGVMAQLAGAASQTGAADGSSSWHQANGWTP